MLPHDREEYRQTMGHVWLGISEKQMNSGCSQRGFKTVRWQPLPPESKTKGPSLFVATARRNWFQFVTQFKQGALHVSNCWTPARL